MPLTPSSQPARPDGGVVGRHLRVCVYMKSVCEWDQRRDRDIENMDLNMLHVSQSNSIVQDF